MGRDKIEWGFRRERPYLWEDEAGQEWQVRQIPENLFIIQDRVGTLYIYIDWKY